MHEDAVTLDPSPKTSSSAPTNKPSVDASQWTHEDIRALTRLRHKYATAEEGEALVDAYFTWASPSTAVVNRRLFLRDMAVNGPYFSDLLLLVMYRSGLRFSPNLSEQERTIRSERYMNLILQMIAEELSKPSSIVTTRELRPSRDASLGADAQRHCCRSQAHNPRAANTPRRGCSRVWRCA